MSLFKNVYSFISYEYVFVILSTIVNIFFVLYFLGFLKNKNALVESISFYLKLFIGFFLVVKFNPFYTFSSYGDKFTGLDKKIVFSAGIYITIINLIVLYNDYQKKNKTFSVTKKDEQISLL
jgi:hypothetical protein